MMNAKFMRNFTKLKKTLKMKNCQRAKNRIKRLPSKVIKELLPKLISKISVNKTTTWCSMLLTNCNSKTTTYLGWHLAVMLTSSENWSRFRMKSKEKMQQTGLRLRNCLTTSSQLQSNSTEWWETQWDTLPTHPRRVMLESAFILLPESKTWDMRAGLRS